MKLCIGGQCLLSQTKYEKEMDECRKSSGDQHGRSAMSEQSEQLDEIIDQNPLQDPL